MKTMFLPKHLQQSTVAQHQAWPALRLKRETYIFATVLKACVLYQLTLDGKRMLLVLAQVELQYPPAKERPTGAGGTTTLQPLSFRPGEAPKAAALPQWAPDQVRHKSPVSVTCPVDCTIGHQV